MKPFRVIKDKMRKIFPQKTNCEILAIIAFGDGVGTEEMNVLHHKLELICSTNINGNINGTCKTFNHDCLLKAVIENDQQCNT